jgi:hypothetical protein
MKQLTIFRILTFILLPFALLFGGIAFFIFFIALANPQLLLFVFVLAGFVIYLFLSLKFLTKGIDPGRKCKPSMRDWIRVNAFVSIYFAGNFLWSVYKIFTSTPAELKELYDQSVELQPQIPTIMNLNLYVTMMHGVAYFFLFISTFLLLHILLNFQLMKKYRYLFEEAQPD